LTGKSYSSISMKKFPDLKRVQTARSEPLIYCNPV
jgi:hypothetical protein